MYRDVTIRVHTILNLGERLHALSAFAYRVPIKYGLPTSVHCCGLRDVTCDITTLMYVSLARVKVGIHISDLTSDSNRGPTDITHIHKFWLAEVRKHWTRTTHLSSRRQWHKADYKPFEVVQFGISTPGVSRTPSTLQNDWRDPEQVTSSKSGTAASTWGWELPVSVGMFTAWT